MALEALKAEIRLLFSTLGNQPEDRYELYLQLKEKLNQCRAFGMPLPADFAALEAELDKEFGKARRSGEQSRYSRNK